MMIDTARHYLPLSKIEKVVDSISECKMNVLHVHLTDAQSFPYLSDSLPALAQVIMQWSSRASI
jgi:hexosaminidase